MANINLLHVSEPGGGHPQEVFQIKAIKAQPANLGMRRSHSND